MEQRTIYLVEDDESIRELIVYALKSAGFNVQGFENAREFYAIMDMPPAPDLVLLDIMLPGESGLQILAGLRAAPATRRLPVIMLTAKGTEYDKVKGLDPGADDYITKPFGVMELLSRVRALLRRCQPEQPSGHMRCGALEVDDARRVVLAQEQPVTLTFKEFELLRFLMKNQGLVLSREKLMEHVWGFDYEGESRTVDMHIKSLRRKLGECAGQIETVRGVGYKLTASIGDI